MAAYNFDENGGSTVTDASGNGNTGQISGASWTTAGLRGSALSFNGNVYVWFGSQISAPIDQPALAFAQLILKPGCALADVQPAAAAVIQRGLANINEFTAKLVHGEWPMC